MSGSRWRRGQALGVDEDFPGDVSPRDLDQRCFALVALRRMLEWGRSEGYGSAATQELQVAAVHQRDGVVDQAVGGAARM